MSVIFKNRKLMFLACALALPISGSLYAQDQSARDPNIIVNGERAIDAAVVADVPEVKGPEVKGTITGRSGDAIKVKTADGGSAIIAFNEATTIKRGSGFLGGGTKLTETSLLNGLPVTIKTLRAGDALVARQITFTKGDLKTANMIFNGTDGRFTEQTAATEALKGRMGDIDQYNIKDTTNVNFDTGKAALSEQAKSELCATASEAANTDNALLLVVGYTDSTGSQEFNQQLSEKRASSVINHLQQACGWKPYRVLTPTGMAEADPLADNNTVEGKAQNRRVAVNILVSKAVDGL